MAWIELHQTLREHKKMFACADALNLSRIEMIGTLVSLWLWALDNAQDGSLAGVSDRTIARVCDFPEKKCGKLMESLHKHGWLDRNGDHYVIHDWYDYAGKLMERREKDRKRKKTSASKHSVFAGISDGIPPERSENSCATVPYSTVQYNTNAEESNKKADGTGAADGALSDGTLFTSFWNAYPENARHRREDAWEAWKKMDPGQFDGHVILERLEVWKKSKRWTDDGGAYIPLPVNFLTPGKGYIQGPLPAPVKQAAPSGASGTLGEAEMEAIRKVLSEESEI